MSEDLETQLNAFDPNDPAALDALNKVAFGGAEGLDQTIVADGETDDEDGSDDAGAKAPGTTAAEGKDAAKQGDTEGAAGNTGEAKAEGATPGAEKVEDQKVVQAKDGKHIIPYSVLEKEREARARAELAAEALANQIKALQEGRPANPADVAAGNMTDDMLADLEKDLPGVAKAFRAQMAVISQLTGEVQNLRATQDVQARTAEHAAQDEESQAIASIPTVAALQELAAKDDPAAVQRWNLVVDQYSSLKDNPSFSELTTTQLIQKAEAVVNTMYGDFPGIAKPAAAPAPTNTQQADVKSAAAARVAQARAEAPLSLSDLPGGAPPASNEQEALESLSAAQLGSKFLSMSTDQIEATLARYSGRP